MKAIDHSPHAALGRAIDRWGSAGIIAGKGPGRHPFQTRMLPPGTMIPAIPSTYCARCGQERNQMIHRAPKRRKCAAFGIFATRPAAFGPENPTK